MELPHRIRVHAYPVNARFCGIVAWLDFSTSDVNITANLTVANMRHLRDQLNAMLAELDPDPDELEAVVCAIEQAAA